MANNRLRIFIASPGDVAEERDIVSLVVSELSRMFEDLLPYQLDAVRWETHAWPDIGDDAQDVINREISEYDIFVGIMWKRFGTPTKREQSGTYEEFYRAYQNFRKYGRPKVMFYFRRSPFDTTDLKELSQFRKVIQFRKKLVDFDVFFWEYRTLIDFERYVREHLIRQIIPLISPKKISKMHTPATAISHQKKTIKPPNIKSHSKGIHPMVFISYSHDDREQVKKIFDNLRITGFNPWLDTEILLPGQNWAREIEHAINGSDAIILCLSNSSVSKVGYFQRELRTVIDMMDTFSTETPYVIPIRLDSTPIPRSVNKLQCLDYFHPDGPEKLIRTLWSVLGKKQYNLIEIDEE